MARLRPSKAWCRRMCGQKAFVCTVALILVLGLVLLLFANVSKEGGSFPPRLNFQQEGQEVWYTAPPDKPISDDALIRCVERWLHTDGVPANTIIPFVILPLTLEWEDFRRFMCRVNAHARYLYIIQNGEVDEMTRVLDTIRSAGSTERLIIERRPSNIGYAGAVNAGYRVALAKPHDEVPFVGVFNCDVYFEKRFFRRYVPDVYTALTPDADRIRALEEEVQKEEAAAKASGFTTLRSAAASIPGLSLSHLLPDRVRYASFAAQRTEFTQHVGLFHFHYQCLCAFFVSRLALLVGGFLDENCYPAYFEDYDWKFRMAGLGFRTFIGPSERYGGFYHGLGGNIRVINEGAAGRSVSYGLEATRVRRMLVAKPGLDYGESKWAWHREAHTQKSLTPFPTVGFVVPVDAWMLDQARLTRIVEIGDGLRPAVELRDTYNLTLLSVLKTFEQTQRERRKELSSILS